MSGKRVQFAWRCMALGGWLALCFTTTTAASDTTMTLERLIELVRQNELLYDEIDVTITDHMETGRMPDEAIAGRDIGNTGTFKLIHTQDSRHRYVAQGKWYRVDSRGQVQFARNDSQTNIQLREYDGETTRSLTGGLGNLVHGYRPCDLPIRPHSLFFLMVGRMDPLSIVMADEGQCEFAYKGERERDGEGCHEVEYTIRVPSAQPGEGTVSEQVFLWLSKKRNLIPLAFVSYDPLCSTAIPVGQGSVTSWVEVEPGIWFPKEVELRVLDRDALRTFGQQVTAWRRALRVEVVSLRPDHPQSFFRTITFPEGTVVYEFEGEKCIRGYRVGSPQDPNVAKGKRGSIHRWLLWSVGVAAVVASIAVVILVRRRRKERVCAAVRSPG